MELARRNVELSRYVECLDKFRPEIGEKMKQLKRDEEGCATDLEQNRAALRDLRQQILEQALQ